MQLAGEDLAHCLIQRQPGRHQVSLFFSGYEVTFGGWDEFQVTGQEDAQALGAEAGRGVVVGEPAGISQSSRPTG